MTSTPSEELLSCPFCGAKAEMTISNSSDWYGNLVVGCSSKDCFVEPYCYGGEPRNPQSAANLAARWNRRSTSSRREVLEEAARVRELALRLVQALNVHSVGAGLNGQAYTDVVGAKNLLARALAEEK